MKVLSLLLATHVATTAAEQIQSQNSEHNHAYHQSPHQHPVPKHVTDRERQAEELVEHRGIKHNIGGGRMRQRTLKNGEKHHEHHAARAAAHSDGNDTKEKMVGATQHYRFGPNSSSDTEETKQKSHTHAHKDHTKQADVTTTDITMCEFCPDGLTAGRDFVMPTGDNATCGMAEDFAATVPPDNPACVTIQLAQAICCAPEDATTTAAPIATEAMTTEAATELPTTEAMVVTTEAPIIDEDNTSTPPIVDEDDASTPTTDSSGSIMTGKASKEHHHSASKSAKTLFAKAKSKEASTKAHKEDMSMHHKNSKAAKAKTHKEPHVVESKDEASAKAHKEDMSMHHKSSKTVKAKMDKNPMAKTHKEPHVVESKVSKEGSGEMATTSKGKGEGNAHHKNSKAAKALFAKGSKEATVKTGTVAKEGKGEGKMSMHTSAKMHKNGEAKMEEKSAKSTKAKMHKNHFAKVHKDPAPKKKASTQVESKVGKMNPEGDMSMMHKGGSAKAVKASTKAEKVSQADDHKGQTKMSAKSSKSKAHKLETLDTKAHKVSPDEATMYKVMSKQSKRTQKGDTVAAMIPPREADVAMETGSMSFP